MGRWNRCLLIVLVWVLVLLGGCTDPEPVAEFTYEPDTPRAGEEVWFDASGSRASRGQIVDYAWTFGDGASAQGVTAVHIYATAGEFTVTLVVTDERGRQARTQKTLQVQPEVNPPPPGGPRASFTAEPREGPAPLQVTFDASASTGTIVAYRWEFGDGAEGTGVTVVHTYTDPDRYTARLTVEDNNGLTHTATRSIVVREPAGGPVRAAFTATPNPAQVGQTVTFDASSSTGPIASYTWEFGDGATAVGKLVQHAYTAEGKYVARLTVRGTGGETDTAEMEVWVYPPLPPPPG